MQKVNYHHIKHIKSIR